MGAQRKATEDANTFARCKHCGVRIGRSAVTFRDGTVTQWRYWNVVDGGVTCKEPGSHNATAMLDGAGEPMFHEPSLPEDLTREGVERWLSS